MGKDARPVLFRRLKKIGAQIPTSHSSVSGLLDRLPPLRGNSDLLVEPVPDEGLARLAVRELPHSFGQLGLGAASNLDSSLQSLDVVLVHGSAEYTNGFVSVNNSVCGNDNPACVTSNKTVCNIVDLAAIRAEKVAKSALKLKSAQKPKPASKPKKTAIPGIDGKTVPQRIREAMIYHAGAMRMREYRQADLVRDVNEIYRAEILSQQNMSAIMNSSSYSNFIPLIAKACGVSAVWLAYGVGDMVEGTKEK
jgi:hypothetical protein